MSATEQTGPPEKVESMKAAVIAPTIGRIVHYRTINDETVPAIITRTRGAELNNEAINWIVDLQVFHYNKGVELATSVMLGDGKTRETWSWPPRS